jgi:hypothetical protein
VHRIDIRDQGLSLLPSDFHPHWLWDRYSDLSELIIEPLRIVTQLPLASSTTHSTRRIPSAWEASEPRERLCG